ncbi:MAG: HAD family hydrolase [Prevotella sp.]|uniref:HAD family hydrolase n=1 Tax=Prevotella sp. TaxID=59823 RepID=UPI002A262280|nr:HAD family hydrolase [Prevotella sp.]MDD7319153.1 HAD family hydrolase [Prevotellaceae bacterium]MDY4020021.1 HAD family hydrolase [Prevotella sp.]
MTKGLIFDYGGTIDTNGDHWGKVIWRGYERCGIAVTEPQFREAYVHAERTLGRNRIIQPSFTFRKTLEIKLRIQMEFLMTEGYWNTSEEDYLMKHAELLEMLYREVCEVVAESGRVLDALKHNHPLVLVSNFYGNISSVLKEFGIDRYFDKVIESAVVGIRKPDPRIFSLGVEALGLPAADVTVVGDSFYKDILPAVKAGCHAIWIKGMGWTEESYDESVPDMIITRLSELLNK